MQTTPEAGRSATETETQPARTILYNFLLTFIPVVAFFQMLARSFSCARNTIGPQPMELELSFPQ